MKEYDIIKAAVAADMPDLEMVRRKAIAAGVKRRIPVVRWAAGAAAALVLATGVYIASQRMEKFSATEDKVFTSGVDTDNTFHGTSSDIKVDINVNKSDSSGVLTDMDALRVEANIGEIPKEFSCLVDSALLDGFQIECLGAVYVRGVKENGQWITHDDYDVLREYHAIYLPINEGIENSGERCISIAMSYIDIPITSCCYVMEEYDVASLIGDTEVMIYGWDDSYRAQFKYGDAYFYIDAIGLTESELVLLINSLMK